MFVYMFYASEDAGYYFGLQYTLHNTYIHTDTYIYIELYILQNIYTQIHTSI